MAEAHPEVIIPSYQDNLVIVGWLSKVLQAHLMLKHELKNLGLRLNPSESEVYIPAWVEAEQTLMQACPYFRRIPQEGAANDEFIQMADATLIKLSRDGLKILGCPMGTDTFCANTLARTALKIEADLQALAVFPHKPIFFFRGMATFFRAPTTFFRRCQKSNYSQKNSNFFQKQVFDCFRRIQWIPQYVSTSDAPKPLPTPPPNGFFYSCARFRVPQPACKTHIFSVNHTHIFSKTYTYFQ